MVRPERARGTVAAEAKFVTNLLFWGSKAVVLVAAVIGTSQVEAGRREQVSGASHEIPADAARRSPIRPPLSVLIQKQQADRASLSLTSAAERWRQRSCDACLGRNLPLWPPLQSAHVQPVRT